MSVTPTPSPEIEARIQELIELYPALADRLARQLLVTLHNKGHATIDTIYDEARGMAGEAHAGREREQADPNSPSSVRWEVDEREAVRRVTFRRAAAHLSAPEVEEALNLVRRREAAESLEGIATLPDVPARLLAERVKRFVQLPAGD